MAERSKAHAWKACVSQGTGGSNPPLSVFSPSGPVLTCSTQFRQVRKEAAVSVVLLSRSKLGGVFYSENGITATHRNCSEDFENFDVQRGFYLHILQNIKTSKILMFSGDSFFTLLQLIILTCSVDQIMLCLTAFVCQHVVVGIDGNF